MGNCLRKMIDAEERKMVTMIVEKIKTIEIKVIEPTPTKSFEFNNTISMEPIEEKPEN